MSRGATRVVHVLVFLNVLLLGVVLRNPGHYVVGGGSIETKLRFLVFGVSAITAALLSYRLWVPRRFVVVLPYAALVTLSAVYSIAPVNSLAQAFVLWSFVGLALLVSTFCIEKGGLDVWRTVHRALATKVGVSVLMPFVGIRWATFGHESEAGGLGITRFPRLGGIMGAPNAMGLTGAAAFLIALVILKGDEQLSKAQKMAYTVSVVLSGVALIWSQSRTAVVGLVLVAIIVTAVRAPRKALVLAVALGIAVLGFWIMRPKTTLALVTRGEHKAQALSTLQGRTVIWSHVLLLAKKKPWLGYGYGTSKTILPAQWTLSRFHAVRQAHNVIMESLLTTGLVGTVGLLVVLAAAIGTQIRQMRLLGQSMGTGSLVSWAMTWMAVVAGVSEPSVAYAQSLLTLVFLMSFALEARAFPQLVESR